MSLVAEYRQQFRWRPWKAIFEEVPLEPGQQVFDLGCAIGDQARILAARRCQVTGLDADQELIDAATFEQIPNCTFLKCNLQHPPSLGVVADGIWCSFTAAYFGNLTEFLTTWADSLRTGGWIAITEIDNLFAHEPVLPRTRLLLRTFVEDARIAGRYDFCMGRRVRSSLEQAGFTVTRVLELPDQELSFQGPANEDVIGAWQKRFERLPGLRRVCASEFGDVREDFLSCLARPDHVSTAKVMTCIARKTG